MSDDKNFEKFFKQSMSNWQGMRILTTGKVQTNPLESI
jgi:hypothetical protein